jgi:non-specific serine/threonine protein kinase
MRLGFGDFVFDLESRELLRAGTAVPLSPKAFQLLGLLVQSRPRALSKGELQDGLWPGTFVVEKNLTNLIGEIRKALGDDAAEPRFIRTVARFGYAFHDPAAIESPGAAPPTRHNLPEPVTSFIGREREMAEVTRRLSSTRLVTLTGAGGCGKTRLALEVARPLLDEFLDGIWLIDLAPLGDPSLVAQSVASVLEVRQAANRSLVQSLAEQMRHRRTLLLLDNCEHVIGATAGLAAALLRAAAGVKILATSREALGIDGETTWRVPSLTVPDAQGQIATADLLHYEAVRLLTDRASATGTTFAVTRDNAATIADVCRRLDGIPLAIELAAARLKVLSIEQIQARLDDRFRLLTRTDRTIGRQRTLEATVDWSYNLLSDAEGRLLRRLSAFAGGWTLDAAEHVGAGDGVERADVLDLMSRLVDKSLVIVGAELDGPRRYRFLETVRDYARVRLQQSGDAAAVRARHFRYFLDLARRAEPELMMGDQLRWLDCLEIEHDNLRAALEWRLASDDPDAESLELAAMLHWFWLKRAYLTEGQCFLERALALDARSTSPRRPQAQMALGSIAFLQGDFTRAERLLEDSATLADAAGQPWLVAITRGLQTMAAMERGDRGAAARFAAASRDAARSAGAPWLESFWLTFQAYEAMQAGEIDRAGELHERLLAMSRAQGDLWGLGFVIFDLALLRVVQQRHAEARALCAEGIALGRQFGDRRAIAWCLGVLAGADAAEGQSLRATRLRGAMEGLLDSIGSEVQPSYHAWIGDRLFGAVQEQLGDDSYQRELAAGRSMSLSQAIEYATGEAERGTRTWP